MFMAGECVLSIPDGYGRKEPGGYWVSPWLKTTTTTKITENMKGCIANLVYYTCFLLCVLFQEFLMPIVLHKNYEDTFVISALPNNTVQRNIIIV